MCGRYYMDDETVEEIEKVIRLVDAKVHNRADLTMLQVGDIHPADLAPVIAGRNHEIQLEKIRWGIPKDDKLIINARTETVLEKKMFADSVEHRRIAIPAAGFYEWNAKKEKYTFRKKDKSLMWFAGFYNLEQNEDRFVILTTAANTSMQPVHDRMPLILDNNEIIPWILGDLHSYDNILKKVSEQLEKNTEFEQLSLF